MTLRVAYTLEQCWHRVPGGTATSALGAARAIAARGDVELVGVAARHDAPPPPAFVPPVVVRHLPLPRPVLYETWHALRRPKVERATGPVDVVHATGMAVPGTDAPLVVTVHDLAFVTYPGHATRHGLRFFRRAIELTRRHAALVLCPSEATRRDCLRHGFDEARLRVVPWGVERPAPDETGEAAVAAARARFALAGRYALWVGTVEPRKNLAALLDAWARLDRRDVQLVLAGPDGWNEDLSGRLARLDGRVRTLGFVPHDQLAPLYAGADVFCYPSLLEGFGMPVLEAMAAGAPVITSAGTATEEAAGGAARTVDPHDVAALADALAEVLDDATHREAMRSAGLAHAATCTWQRTAADTVAAYREAVR